MISDSPGVIRWLAEHRGASMGASARMGSDTDSIGGHGLSKFSASFQEVEHCIRRFVDRGLCHDAETLAQAVVGTTGRTLRPTSFTWPAIARSVSSISQWEHAHFPDVFLRDFVMSVISGFGTGRPSQNTTDCNGVGRWSRVCRPSRGIVPREQGVDGLLANAAAVAKHRASTCPTWLSAC